MILSNGVDGGTSVHSGIIQRDVVDHERTILQTNHSHTVLFHCYTILHPCNGELGAPQHVTGENSGVVDIVLEVGWGWLDHRRNWRGECCRSKQLLSIIFILLKKKTSLMERCLPSNI